MFVAENTLSYICRHPCDVEDEECSPQILLVGGYGERCRTVCQWVKPDRTKRAAPLYPHSVPQGPWSVISWDIIGPLPLSHGHNAILVIVDKFTKRTLIEGIGMDLTGLGAARIL